MVGCETLTTKTNGLPPTTQSVLDKTASGPATGCASGTAPGHISTCVCPGDGCQTFVCALRLPHAKTATKNIWVSVHIYSPAYLSGPNAFRLSGYEPRNTESSRRAVHHDLIAEQANLGVALDIDGFVFAPSVAKPMEGR